MIVLLDPDASPVAIDAIFLQVKEMGLEPMMLDDAKGQAFEVLGEHRGRVLALRDAPGVAGILTRRVALKGGEPIWPHFLVRVSIVGLLVLTLVLLLVAFLPPGLGDKADPGLDTAVPPEWYLRPLAGFLHLFPRTLGGVLATLTWILLLFWPFLDRAGASSRSVLLVRLLGVALLIFVVVLALVPA